MLIEEGVQMLRSDPGQSLMKMLHLDSYCVSVPVILSVLMLCCCPGCYGCTSMRLALQQEIMKREGCLSPLLLKYTRCAQQPGKAVFFNRSMAVVASSASPFLFAVIIVVFINAFCRC